MAIKGLISLAINILAFIIAMVVTLLLYKPIGNIIINNTTVDEKLQQMIQTKIEEFMKMMIVKIVQVNL